jgi:hypothetical protein
MTRRLGAAALVLCAAGAGAEPAAAAQTVADRLGWIAGCWSGQRGASTFREIWTVASPDLMVGMSVSTRGPGKVEFEFLRVESRPDGGAAYVAQPGGIPPIVFTLDPAASTPDRAVFTNPAHDYPRRITYTRADGGLTAAIDEGEPGQKRMEFPMKKGGCPGQDAAR